MCGIIGLIGKNTENKETLIKKMADVIAHRGPDDEGFFVDEKVALGMRRLSIIDLSGGKQPIENDDGSMLITFNGEIYNYKELRNELVQKGVNFKTHSDTEVILKLYEQEKEKMMTRLRGMFSFCVYDKKNGEIFIARDYFGIKPLYYLKLGGEIKAFGSEIKSLLLHPEYKKEINDEAVFNYLFFQYNPLKETMFKNIFKLAPGHFMKINLNTGHMEEARYWSFSFSQNGGMEEKSGGEELLRTLEDSVAHHMVSDVPVGSFLSGGIDSGIIATLMQKISQKETANKKISTFTVGFKNLSEGLACRSFNESREAKDVSNSLRTDHTEIAVSADEYFQVLPKIIWHFDEPVADPSAVALYFVAREAGKKVKVVLSGEGADELFGGYNIYLAPYARGLLNIVPKFLRDIIFLPLLKSKIKFRGKNYLSRYYSKLEDWYIGNASIFKKEEVKKIWKGGDFNRMDISDLYKKASGLSDSTKMQFIDINTWLVGDILAKADKMTMANSLELRVPFLDIKVAEFARKIPDFLKFRKGTTKFLLRQALKGILPEPTRKRKKLGFPTPIAGWLTKEKTELYKKITENEYIRSRMDIGYINELLNRHIEGRENNARKIYLLLSLAIWQEVFFSDTIK